MGHRALPSNSYPACLPGELHLSWISNLVESRKPPSNQPGLISRMPLINAIRPFKVIVEFNFHKSDLFVLLKLLPLIWQFFN